MSPPGNINDPAGDDTTKNTTTSFVYPVRSLLSGIQPSITRGGTESSHVIDGPGRVEEGKQTRMEANDTGTEGFADKVVLQDTPERDQELIHEETSSKPKRKKRLKPNFRDFSPGEDPLIPRTFVTSTLSSAASGFTSVHSASTLFTEGPVGESVEYHSEDLHSSEDETPYNPRHPPQLSEIAVDAFADVTTPSMLDPTLTQASYLEPQSNFSQTGIVHLPPMDSLSGPRSQSLGSSRGRSSRSSGLAEAGRSDVDLVRLPLIRRESTSGSASESASASGSGTGTSASSLGGPHIAFRYQHMEDEDGHHLVVGREGKLARCEDEPIRTPGAVQGFGVLIAIEEEDSGNLSVRQVSENSTELLGLSPAYLFSLECFTQVLADPQADILIDNIQYLSDAALTSEEQAENLHVFMLSGFGEPGSGLPEDTPNDPQGRRNWMCWCAAHRPEMTAPANMDPDSSTAASLERNLIILEFELERDHFNPLYPVTTTEDGLSGVSSPSDASGSTDGTNSGSSGRTLVSTSSEEHVYGSTPEGSTPSVNGSDPSAQSMTAPSPSPSSQSGGGSAHEVHGSDEWIPDPEAILASTTSYSKPLLALERLRRNRRGLTDSSTAPMSAGSSGDRGGSVVRRGSGGLAARRRRGQGVVGMMDVFSVMAQINEQLGAAPDLDSFLKVVAGVIKDLTQFHRVLVYQFDEAWNGKVVAELVDWSKTHDLYRGLHFPASDIPAQARHLYALNKVRLLYDRGQPTARLVIRSKRDLETPLDMTHCYLRAMSPIHIKYLGNMGVRASMSVSIMAFGQLWGLVACHSYGAHGMRVSFPVRQMLRLLSQSISRNVERLTYAQRLHTRKLINTMPTDKHPSGYIVSDANDLLGLFDADYGVLVIGEGAKILGPNQHGQEILVVAEYLRMKQFDTMQASQAVTVDYPDLQLSTGLEVIAGLLYIPLSVGGGDFIAFLRTGQPQQVNWAGRPLKEGETKSILEPRKSFKMWSETVAGQSRAWSDEHLETAGVLALVYGKFIEVWRQKESALQTTKLTNILLSNASHEVRTPLNHIINYLELALNGQLDLETRENLNHSHAASKSLLFTINDLLDLTRLESGGETSFNEPFDLHAAVQEATLVYRNEAARRGIQFKVDLGSCPSTVLGDARKIRTVISNLTANALKFTHSGEIIVECRIFEEPEGLRKSRNVAVEIIVSDTGCGIPPDKLESIFREFEQVEGTPPPPQPPPQQPKGLGLGLAVVARIVEQLGGQLRVDSKVNEGSRFSFLIPFSTGTDGNSSSSSQRSRTHSPGSGARESEIESLVSALQAHTIPVTGSPASPAPRHPALQNSAEKQLPPSLPSASASPRSPPTIPRVPSHNKIKPSTPDPAQFQQLRILIVEDNDINRTILAKRLTLDGHIIVNTTNGQEGYDMVESDRDFDCVLMDIQMPLLNGYEATERIRALEQDEKTPPSGRLSHRLNGRLPIFAVSASLLEVQRSDMYNLGIDGWILKPIDFKRLRTILRGVTDVAQREKDVYTPGCSWELGGWLASAKDYLEDETP